MTYEISIGQAAENVIDRLAKLQATRGDDAARRQLQSLKADAKRKAA